MKPMKRKKRGIRGEKESPLEERTEEEPDLSIESSEDVEFFDEKG